MRTCGFSLLTPHRKQEPARGARALSPEALPSSRQARSLFLCRPEDLTAKEQATVARLRQLHPEVDLAYVLVQQFVQMLRTRTGEQLDTWLEAVASSPLTDLQSFVGSVYEDKEAIVAGLTRAESNGPTEERERLLASSRLNAACMVAPSLTCSGSVCSLVPKSIKRCRMQKQESIISHVGDVAGS